MKLVGYLHISRIDLAQKTLTDMRKIEDDNCLITLCQTWISFHDPKAPLQTYETTIQNINELSDKYGYTLKTYNILGIVLMI